MNKLTKAITISAAVLLLGGAGISGAYAHALSERLEDLRRESHSQGIYLRSRIRELESEWRASLMAGIGNGDLPAGSPWSGWSFGKDTDSSDSKEPMTDPSANTPIESVPVESTEALPPSVEEATLPILNTPETLPAPEVTAVYLVTEHNGIIGLFDAAGELLESVNVFVMTLPEADRMALENGIAVGSFEEGIEVMGRFG